MKKIACIDIKEQVKQLCIKANYYLPDDVKKKLTAAGEAESNPEAAVILAQIIENAAIASKGEYPLCQDTGLAVFFISIGEEVLISGGSLYDAVCEGTRAGYEAGYLRKSVVDDPLFERKNTGTNLPPVIHTEIVPGSSLEIICAPKGGGAENMSALKMLKPADGEKGVIDFVVSTVVAAGGNPCPPVIAGVGIGGTFEKCAWLAKKALLRPLDAAHTDLRYAELENKIYTEINRKGKGPQGLGGDTTCLKVSIEYCPCHIASLPVAVNINCHAARHLKVVL